MHSQLLFATLIHLSLEQSFMGSGEGILLLPTCGPPDLPSYELNTTEENYNLLIHEGRCYLICLTDEFSEDVNIYEYKSWLFATFKNTENCRTVSMVHECTRGCRLRFENLDINNCGANCVLECYDECQGTPSCINADINDMWMPNISCSIACSTSYCQNGCNDGRDTINYGDPSDIPSLPDSQLIFVQRNDTDERGLISVVFPESTEEGDYYTAFLFRIEDKASGNVTYIWQHDPREILNLSGYACRTVDVSLSLVNPYGHTTFTDPVRLYIEGNEAEIPDAPEILNVSEKLDRDFFQHVILTITWQHPQDDTYLRHYMIVLIPDMNCNLSTIPLESKILYNNWTSIFSTTFRANQTGDHPVIGCTYTIEVFSVGKHGKTSNNPIRYTVKTLEAYMDDILSHFDCNKVIGIQYGSTPKAYFIFNLRWKLILYENYIDQFRLDYRIYNIITKQESDAEEDRNYTDLIASTNSYSTPYKVYSQPRRNEDDLFLFKLRIVWNRDDLYIATLTKPYNCTLSALSPAPTEVRNIIITSAEAVTRSMARVNASWTRPLETNGVLSNYMICLTRSPLKGNEPAVTTADCISISSDQTSIDADLKCNSHNEDSYTYFQIQPTNTYVAGNWSDGYPIILPNRSYRSSIIAGTTSMLAIIIVVGLVVAAILVFLCKYRRHSNRVRLMVEIESNFVEMNGIKTTIKDVQTCVEYDFSDEWELPPSRITVKGDLGHGAFGVVKKGYLQGPLLNSKVKLQFRNASCIPVAIKKLNEYAIGSERQDFVSEIEMMKKVSEGHNPHVVAMLGCVTTQEPLCLLIEFVKFGDLLSYLRNNRNPGHVDKRMSTVVSLSPVDLLNFSYQIADGMDFLSSKGVIHRDLACRNILVDEGKVLKITDFGLSRETEKYMKSTKGRVPFKWMPIEFLELGEFTFASDVWSFGVVLWEIATFGGEPYPGVSNSELLSFLKEGGRLKKPPEDTAADVYDIMQSCWNEEPSKRPKFSLLKEKFSEILLSQRSTNEYVFLGEFSGTGSSGIEGEKLQIPKSTSMSQLSTKQNPAYSRCISWNPGVAEMNEFEFSHQPSVCKSPSDPNVKVEYISKSELPEYPGIQDDADQHGSMFTQKSQELQDTKGFGKGNKYTEVQILSN